MKSLSMSLGMFVSAVVFGAVGCAAQPASETDIAEESAALKSESAGSCPYGTAMEVDGEVWCDISSDANSGGSSDGSSSGSSGNPGGGGGGGVQCPGGTYSACAGGYCYKQYLSCCVGRACSGGGNFWASDPGSTECRTDVWACDNRCASTCTG